jgi:hypothetical protein
MKTNIKILFLAGALTFAVSVSKAQDIVVRTRMRPPVATLRTRPAAPSPRHVWIEEEWAPRGTSYTWKGGYWALPPHRGAAWVPGHWRHVRRGWVWRPGHWR